LWRRENLTSEICDLYPCDPYVDIMKCKSKEGQLRISVEVGL